MQIKLNGDFKKIDTDQNSLNLSLVIKKLNLKYKKNNKTTDVLTFISEYKNDKKLT